METIAAAVVMLAIIATPIWVWLAVRAPNRAAAGQYAGLATLSFCTLLTVLAGR